MGKYFWGLLLVGAWLLANDFICKKYDASHLYGKLGIASEAEKIAKVSTRIILENMQLPGKPTRHLSDAKILYRIMTHLKNNPNA